jgi:D-3-phosphoglycerate dehydrogenase
VLTLELHGAAGKSHATGTVIHGEQPRLLEFDGIDIETPLEGNLLVCRNQDVPGVIGKIGSILGEHGVNIANFALGRERSGPKPVKALAVVQVDAPVPAKVLEALATIPALIEAKPVSLPEAKF